MNNFELHEKAQELSDVQSAYKLARIVIKLEQHNQLRCALESIMGTCAGSDEELAALHKARITLKETEEIK